MCSSHDDFPTFVIVFQRIPKAAVVFKPVYTACQVGPAAL